MSDLIDSGRGLESISHDSRWGIDERGECLGRRVMAVSIATHSFRESPFAATAHGVRQEMYARLSEAGPLHTVVMPSGATAWVITGFDEVRAALTDPRLVKAGPNMTGAAAILPPGIDRAMNTDLLHLDPPDHDRLRRLVTA